VEKETSHTCLSGMCVSHSGELWPWGVSPRSWQ